MSETEIGGEAVEIAVTVVQSDAGGGIFAAMCAFFVCCIPKVATWWRSLKTEKKLFASVIFSMLVGTFDTVMDLIVVTQWYSDDSIWWGFPTFIVCCIFIPCVFIFSLFSGQWESLMGDRLWITFVFLASFLGFSNFAFGIFWIYHPGRSFSNGRLFRLARVMEIFIEAAPAGAVQLYVVLKDGIYEFNVNTISICASIFSISVGIEESLAQSLPLWDRIAVLFCSLFDFVFRVTSMSMFLKQYSASHFILVPCVYLFEVITISSITLFNDKQTCSMKIFMALLWAIPMVATAGPFIALQNATDSIRAFEFLARLILGIFFLSFCIATDGKSSTELWVAIVSLTGTIIFSIRVASILYTAEYEMSIYAADRHKIPRATTEY